MIRQEEPVSYIYILIMWTSAVKQFLLFYASPLSLSFTYLKLFLYTQYVVCVLYLVRVLYPVRNPWSTVGSTCNFYTDQIANIVWCCWVVVMKTKTPKTKTHHFSLLDELWENGGC